MIYNPQDRARSVRPATRAGWTGGETQRIDNPAESLQPGPTAMPKAMVRGVRVRRREDTPRGEHDHEKKVPGDSGHVCGRTMRFTQCFERGCSSRDKAPGVNGIWLAYAWATGQGKPSSPNQFFVLNNSQGSARVTGTLAEFKILGTFSPVTGKATLVVGVQPGTTQTTNYHVKFVFKSNSTAQTNHPTFSGSFDYVRRATGQPVRTARARSQRSDVRTRRTPKPWPVRVRLRGHS